VTDDQVGAKTLGGFLSRGVSRVLDITQTRKYTRVTDSTYTQERLPKMVKSPRRGNRPGVVSPVVLPVPPTRRGGAGLCGAGDHQISY
jgi:hypothetical protein